MILQAKGKLLEISKEISSVRKHIIYLMLIGLISAGMIIYNSKFLELEKQITALSQEKMYLQIQTLNLKKDYTKLISPERISKIAKRKLKMKKVDLSKVKFLEYK